MKQFSFMASSLLAIAGSTMAIFGVLEESFKAVFIGIILIFTAGVFATLTLASRTGTGSQP